METQTSVRAIEVENKLLLCLNVTRKQNYKGRRILGFHEAAGIWLTISLENFTF